MPTIIVKTVFSSEWKTTSLFMHRCYLNWWNRASCFIISKCITRNLIRKYWFVLNNQPETLVLYCKLNILIYSCIIYKISQMGWVTKWEQRSGSPEIDTCWCMCLYIHINYMSIFLCFNRNLGQSNFMRAGAFRWKFCLKCTFWTL